MEMTSDSTSIAIVGIGMRLPGGCSTPQGFWDNLLDSFDGVSEVPPERWSDSFYKHRLINSENIGMIPLDEWKKFDPLFFGISPKDASALDPQERMLLMVAYEALEDAQIPSSKLRGSKTGVFVGVSAIDYSKAMLQKQSYLDYTPKIPTDSFHYCLIANRVSYSFDFKGPSMSVDTACSSSLVSTELAIQYLQNGSCDVSLACGINSLFDPTTSIGYNAVGILGDLCHSFDADAKGYVRSEGCGVVVLKRLSDAERDGNRIYGVIRGISSSTDGNKVTMTTPSKDAQATNTHIAIDRANINPSDIYYVEAHATGTPIGDPIEVESLSSVFTKYHSPEHPLKIGSVKPNIGHLESASGIVSLIKVSLMLKNRKLVPTINIKQLNPNIPFKDYNIQVVTQVENLPDNKPIYMGVNSFGIGGVNCHAVLQEYVKEDRNQYDYEEKGKQLLVPISSNSLFSLEKYNSLLIENNMEYRKQMNFKEFAIYQSLSKSHLSYRQVVIAEDWDDFLSQKNKISQLSSLSPHKELNSNKVIFVFSGQGPQWNMMGMELYHSNDIYRSTVQLYDSQFKKYTGYSVLEKMQNAKADEMHHPIIAQPSLFLFQISLVELYKHYGITPSAVVGHSFGDVTAAYVSGSLSMETAVKVVHYRALYQNETIGSGRMIVIGMKYEDFEQYNKLFPTLEIACFNSPSSIVVAGDEQLLNDLSIKLKSEGIFNTFLRTPCSFHSESQKSIKSKILESLKDMNYNNPIIPWYSTVTGMKQSTGMTAKYLYDNLRRPVRFQRAIESIAKDLGSEIDEHIFVEIAPHPTLSNLIKQCIPSSKVISPLQRNSDGISNFLTGIANLYCQGVNVSFSSQFNKMDLRSDWKEKTSNLPRYQWDSDLYWKESELSKFNRLKGPTTTILGHKSEYNGQISYHSDIDLKRPPYQFLKDHKAQDKPLFAGTGYLDCIVQSMKSYQKDIAVNQLDFTKAFFLNEQELPQRLQTFIDKVNSTDYKFQFFFKNSEAHDPNEEWNQSAKANVSLINPSGSFGTVDIAEFASRCNITKITSQEFYLKTHRFGLFFGPAFQHVESMLVGKNTTLSKLKLKTTPNTPDNIFSITLYDNCIHGLFGLVDERRLLIGKTIDGFKLNIELFNKIESKELLVSELYLAYTLTKFDNYNYSGISQLLTPDGEIILEIKNLIVSAPARLKMKKVKFNPLSHWESILQSKDSTLSTPNSAKPALLLSDSQKSFEFLSATQYAVRMLYSSLVNHIPTFDIADILEQPINQLMSKFNVINTQSGIRLFTRCIELLREYFDCIQSDKMKITAPSDSLLLEVIQSATQTIPKVLIGDSNLDWNLLSNITDVFPIQSKFMKCYYNQICNLVGSSLDPLLQSKEKRIVKILEIGGGSGALTHSITAYLDNIIKDQENIQVYYTFTDVNQSYIDSAKEYYKKIEIQSNLKVKFRLLDLDSDILDQEYIGGCYDVVLMSNVIHIIPDIEKAINNIHQIISPSGSLLFIEPNKKNALCDILYGGFSQIWNFNDSLRTDHYSIDQDQWKTLLESNGFINTKSYGLIDEKGHKLPISSSTSFIIHSQRSSIISFSPNDDYSNDTLLILNNNQSLDIQVPSSSVIRSNEIETNQSNIKKYKFIIFLAGIDQLTSDNYQSATYDLVLLLKVFIDQPKQSKLCVITRNCKDSNYFAHSLTGIVRSAHSDYKLNIAHLDIDTDLQEDHLKLITHISNNLSNLGDFEYYMKDGILSVERLIHTAKELMNQSNAFEKDKNNLGCKLNLNLEYKLFEKQSKLDDNQVEIIVKAVGLNFKDLLFKSQIIPQDRMVSGDHFHPSYGLECSGIISRVGAKVNEFKVGDEVVGISQNSLTSHAITTTDLIVHKPKSMTFEEAASIPVTYGTVYYSLFNIGQLELNDQTVLIHSATGGVGIAAMEILKWRQAGKNVYATAGSKDKVDFLKSNYSDMLIDVYNSRTKEYSAQIGSKVDLILNTLSSEFMTSNFKTLSPFGRIVDLSQTHIYNNEPLDFANFKYDHQYSSIDFQFISTVKPRVIKNIFKKIFTAIEEGQLRTPPINVFNCLDAQQAIQSLSISHIGKIVVDCSNMENDILQGLIQKSIDTLKPLAKKEYRLSEISNSVVIVGQSGVAFQTIPWVVEHSNASDVIILSASPLKYKMKALVNLSKHIHFYQVDISNIVQLRETFERLIVNHPPIEMIINFGNYYEDIPMADMEIDNIRNVHNPKAVGTFNIHTVTTSLNIKSIKQLILTSSISAFVGSTSQPAYCSANLVMESLANYRTNVLGLHTKSIRFGPILGEGIVADSSNVKEYLQSRGVESIQPSELFGGLSALTQSQYTNPFLVLLVHSKIYNFYPRIRAQIEHFVNEETKKKVDVQNVDVREIINNGLSLLLSISTDKIGQNTKLKDFGVDSLATVNVKSFFDKNFTIDLFSVSQIPSLTINNIVQTILNNK